MITGRTFQMEYDDLASGIESDSKLQREVNIPDNRVNLRSTMSEENESNKN